LLFNNFVIQQSGPGHIYNFSQRQCGWRLVAANQDASNGHIL